LLTSKVLEKISREPKIAKSQTWNRFFD
jgi:hypothetical protein